MPRIEPAAGRGIGAVEAPRGLLIHDYAYDAAGRCTKANCVIPTNQNFANLDLDMQALLRELAGASKDEVQRHLEMLVRAYDPCISCSVH
jgi:sulfhydrogenase subunit alpha